MRRSATALDHLNMMSDRSSDVQPLDYLQAKLKVETRRPKAYRIVLRSEERVGGTATSAIFDLGDLTGAWNLTSDNIDAGARHYHAKLDSFHMSCYNATPSIIEIQAAGFPLQSESFDSGTLAGTELLGVATGAVNVSLDAHDTYMTLRSVPSGRVIMKLVSRDAGNLQALLDSDDTVRWVAVISIVPTK